MQEKQNNVEATTKEIDFSDSPFIERKGKKVAIVASMFDSAVEHIRNSINRVKR